MLMWILDTSDPTDDTAICVHVNTADTPTDYCFNETGLAKGASFATILAACNATLTAASRTNETQG